MAYVDEMLERVTKQLGAMTQDGPMVTGLRLACVWVTYYRAQVRNEVALAAMEIRNLDESSSWDDSFDDDQPTPSPYTKEGGE